MEHKKPYTKPRIETPQLFTLTASQSELANIEYCAFLVGAKTVGRTTRHKLGSTDYKTTFPIHLIDFTSHLCGGFEESLEDPTEILPDNAAEITDGTFKGIEVYIIGDKRTTMEQYYHLRQLIPFEIKMFPRPLFTNELRELCDCL
ncbi:hypothetical protein GOV03_04445 [Candidatus Woesearchaeota archaeon]|nr:hypothetical protein [Candidatus Woesearchaeota archaeon]